MEDYNNVNRWVCVIDIENAQHNYARCLQLILWLEQVADEKTGWIQSAPEMFMPFYISRAKRSAFTNREALLAIEALLEEKDPKKCKEIETSEMLMAGLKKENKENQFSYYLRIHLNKTETDITELQYLVLLLQTIPALQSRVAVRLMESHDETWETGDYFRVSNYLRFIQIKHQCFFACYNEELSTLQMLTHTAEGVQTTFLPLLEVDAQLCQVLNKTWTLSSEFSNQSYDKLYTALSPQGCNVSDFAGTLFQIGLRMFFDNLPGHKIKTPKAKQELLSFLTETVNEVQGITPLDMLLYGVLATDKLSEKLDKESAKAQLGAIQTFSLGISQILENIVNHSEHNKGVFTFRLQGNVEYLKSHYPSYSFSDKKPCLELMMADSNHNDGIVDHFLKSSKSDQLIKKYEEEICLADLFGDHKTPEIEKVWKAARNKRPEMCHGLLSFASCVRDFHGAIRVRSAPQFVSKSERDVYYYNGNPGWDNGNHLTKEAFIPGTQFSIVVNRPVSINDAMIAHDSENWAFDFDKLVYATTYQDLAQALRFDEDVHVLAVDNQITPSKYHENDQKKKDSAVAEWKAWFDEESQKCNGKQRIVYQCDLEVFCKRLDENPMLGEPFCKGFLSSSFFIPSAATQGKVYRCILFQNPSASFSRLFASTLKVMAQHEDFETEDTYVYFYPKRYQGDHLPYCATTLCDLLKKPSNTNEYPHIFPYSLFLRNEDGYTLFEQEMRNQANTPIYDQEQGFKIPETHMRLGNKVHIDTFYEMAPFFENPNCAYYTAFLFVRELLKHHLDQLCSKKQLLFYGYASYSRATIWAIIQILTDYQQLQDLSSFPEMAFVIYQNDLKIESEQPQIQMYYSHGEWQQHPETIWKPEDTALVMIVPISSSLTTFSKMEAELQRETNKKFHAIENFTAFWVRNHFENEEIATREEQDFWETVDPRNRIINSPIVQGCIRYLISVTSEWSNPLVCRRCFPDETILEYPLVETDPTSTIPTQQFYPNRSTTSSPVFNNNTENDARVARLKGNILYGHISKGNNHYQYYIKTRVYFQQERNKIAVWLKELRRQAIEHEDPSMKSTSCINVMIVPQQIDNVEFSQYVYEYFFQGCAECVIINTEKEYRSNLNTVYSGLFQRLREVKHPAEVRFHYIDISIRSGSSFNRALSLVSSCLEFIGKKHGLNEKAGLQLEHIFLLVNRLSESSKRMYSNNPDSNFHAYVDLHISAMRTYGDSCVPCKVQNEAVQYYRKAATKSISSYWEKKAHHRACIPFDQFDVIVKDEAKQSRQKEYQEEGYRRMVCSHRAAYHIRPIQGSDIPTYFSAIREFLSELCASLEMEDGTESNSKRDCCVYQEITQNNRKEWLSAGLKILVRPFFTFDYKLRCVAMDLLLILSEMILKGATVQELRQRLEDKKKTCDKTYLLDKDHLEWCKCLADKLMTIGGENHFQRIVFFRSNVLKGLADIKSNYLLRKETMIRISQHLSVAKRECDLDDKDIFDYYEHYLRSILRIIHSSSDETKGVWLEYLLQYGAEYQLSLTEDGSSAGIEKLISQVPENVAEPFRDFLERLLVENNRPLYQAVVEYNKKAEQTPEIELSSFLCEHHMRNAAKFLSYGCNVNTSCQFESMRNLLQPGRNDTNYKQQYQRLGADIQSIVELEAEEHKNIVLFGKKAEATSVVERFLYLSDYFVLYPEQFKGEKDYRKKSSEHTDFEEAWKRVKETPFIQGKLEKTGFYLLENDQNPNKVSIIIKLDNNYDDLNHGNESDVLTQKIEPIFIYIPCALSRQNALVLTRKILMFRSKLVEWLEKDFNNNAIAVLSQQQHIAKLLSTDKMGDHAENDFVECQQKLLLATTQDEFDTEKTEKNWEYTVDEAGQRSNLYEMPDDAQPPLMGHLNDAREFFFLRSYINSRISRMFRTMIRMGNELGEGRNVNSEDYYALKRQSILMYPAHDLQTVFFTPVKVGYIRKNYLKQIMKVVSFQIEGKNDYGNDEDAKLNQRLENVSEQLRAFQCVRFISENTKEQYAYLSEYLAVILLDCFISGLKAGKDWNQARWSGEAYFDLAKKPAAEKCVIKLDREKGKRFAGVDFDYLVISNKVHHSQNEAKKGPGMSQAATCWYIEGLWHNLDRNDPNVPRVIATRAKSNEYVIKLPILKCEEEHNG